MFFFALYYAKVVSAAGAVSLRSHGLAFFMGNTFSLDQLSAFMLVLINLIGALACLYSFHYVSAYRGKWKFFTLFMLMLAGLNGVVLTQDMFTLYVYVELASISAYSLVAFGGEAADFEASFKYLIMGSLASIFILLGIALLYSFCSTLNMIDLYVILNARPGGILPVLVSVLFFVGFGLKSAVVPFHAWLPDAHASAPSPVSAVLSGVVIKTVGIYALARVFFNVLGFNTHIGNMFIFCGVLSMVAGAFLAVKQNDIKRMLAYSSISQIGYIIFALGIGTPLSIFAALFHVFNHAVSKSLLFLNAGAIEQATGTRFMNKLGGLSGRMPVVSNTSLVGALSISGIPPAGGFFSKLFIIIAAAQAGYFALAAVAVGVSIMTLVYYLKFQTQTFYAEPSEALTVKATPWTMKVPLVILAFLSVVSFCFALPIFRPFIGNAADILSALLP